MSETDQPDPPGADAARRRWRDLGPRVISAFILLPITAFTLWLGGYIFAAVVGLVFAGVYNEWETMVARRTLSVPGMVMIGLVALSAIAFPLAGLLGSAIPIALAIVVAAIWGGEGFVWRVVGLVFIGLVIVSVLAIRGTTGEGVALGVFMATAVWMTDTAAFFAGRQIGGEKLAPDISPSKTWSGALGGLLLGTAAATLVWVFITPAPWWIGTLLAAAISVLGQLGDLSESALKRRFRVKDSGDIIPGHGGLMDRLDSLTFAVLFVFAVGLARGGWTAVAPGFLGW